MIYSYFLVATKYDQLKPLAIKIKELLSNKSKYNKSRLFDIILKLLDNDSYNGEKNYLIESKDLLVNKELEHEIDIINELMLDDGTFNKNKMGVNLLTIHKAKGLEFKCIFIISLNDGIIPANLTDNNLIEEEEKRLYVTMTRTKEYLYLSSTEYHYINGIRKRLRPSIFLCELK